MISQQVCQKQKLVSGSLKKTLLTLSKFLVILKHMKTHFLLFLMQSPDFFKSCIRHERPLLAAEVLTFVTSQGNLLPARVNRVMRKCRARRTAKQA